MHLTREREAQIRKFVDDSEGGFLGVIVAQPMIKELLDEVDRQRKVITQELTENDDYGAEYSFVLCCKEEIRRLLNDTKKLRGALVKIECINSANVDDPKRMSSYTDWELRMIAREALK